MNKSEMNKINYEQCWKCMAVLLFSLLFTTGLAFQISAMPLPHGISGTVYELDGITEVDSGIDFSINDTTTGEFIVGKTGYGSPGRYSASLNGNDGDTIIITVWNIANKANRTVTLSGVMRNVNILLNMTLPNYPPEIISEPVVNASEGQTYSYDVDATDINDDDLVFSLIESPFGLTINESNGLITWVPATSQIGSNNVVVIVSDGELNDTQSFVIDVVDVNNPPIIVSTPQIYSKMNQIYFYDVDAVDTDLDRLYYSLIKAPKDMEIARLTGKISWVPRKKDLGNNSVIVEVTDGINNVLQEFDIFVYKNEHELDDSGQQPDDSQGDSSGGSSSGGYGGSGSGGWNGTSVKPTPNKDDEKRHVSVQGSNRNEITFEIKKSIVKQVNIKSSKPMKDVNLKIEEYSSKPDDLSEALAKKVYLYLKIDAMNMPSTDIEEAIIKFNVDKRWLEDNNMDQEDVILNRYTEHGWEELQTNIISAVEDYVNYQAISQGFSYFGISSKEKSYPGEIKVSGIKNPFKILVTVYGSNHNQVAEGTPFILENLNTGEKVIGVTGIGDYSGRFAAVIHGSYGDNVSAIIGSSSTPYFLTLEKDINQFDLISDGRGDSYVPLTGYSVFSNYDFQSGNALVVAILLLLMATFVPEPKIRRSKKSSKRRIKRNKLLLKNKK